MAGSVRRVTWEKMKQSAFRPRDMLNKEVAGICGVARLADKARAAHAGEIGSYKYGADSKQDTGILSLFNRKLRAWWQNNMPRDDFSKRRRKLAEKDENRSLFWFFPSAWLWKNFFRR